MPMESLKGQKKLICSRDFLLYDLSQVLVKKHQSVRKLLWENQFLRRRWKVKVFKKGSRKRFWCNLESRINNMIKKVEGEGFWKRFLKKVPKKGSQKRFPKKVPQKGSQESFGIKACKLNFVVSGPEISDWDWEPVTGRR